MRFWDLGFFISLSLQRGSCYNDCHYNVIDCQYLLDIGHTSSGVYNVTPYGTRLGFRVYCDMDTDGGGWLVFQRRLDGTEDFYRKWTEYEKGFGNPEHEYWLGLLPLKVILSQGVYELRIDLEDWDGEKRFAKYSNFDIGNSRENYELTASIYSGDAGNALATHNGQKFSTNDKDNDVHVTYNCAALHKGAWWYRSCKHANLNGKYHTSNPTAEQDGVHWYEWKGHYHSLKTTEMKIRMM